ncbi:hypothetical protein [Liquorilactobacillus mali]|uniref:Uncharacterized protein n=1 Tax=Liquorilactobacillus mali KCTC 3596 = DSM 20444 TaxID=1046596 RepID=J0UPR0_9LACO|nr:hypothetical protein [Liquorilactobacillus mali]EJE97537.1 hypothetical protein LMA_09705 [Liquorilactobacillus mali KCTC 3596 = DSM 20444]KRN11219.1 hypothetical protein FD00_GL001221 [Liquorilactobacillus mali KCTC 3596 = DSM 20444]QFQ73789.1 hypothetical protein LM596_00900 [Liquorilactobacillus mali]
MVFGHILFGTIAVIGVLLLEVGFYREFNRLNMIQKLGIFLTIFGLVATTALGIFLTGNVLAGIVVAVLGVALLGILVRPVFGTEKTK